jgi:hypothetical protein
MLNRRRSTTCPHSIVQERRKPRKRPSGPIDSPGIDGLPFAACAAPADVTFATGNDFSLGAMATPAASPWNYQVRSNYSQENPHQLQAPLAPTAMRIIMGHASCG